MLNLNLNHNANASTSAEVLPNLGFLNTNGALRTDVREECRWTKELYSRNVINEVKFAARRNKHGVVGKTEFTKNNFKVTRGNFHSLDEHHVEHFAGIVGETNLIMDLSDLEQYNVDWMKHLRGNSKLALRPKTTEDISKILAYCNHHKLPVCTQAGNTSLVGGAVPVLDEIIISTSRLNRIISIDETSGVLVCDAGCILETLDDELHKHGLMMPLDLGARGSCQIGGNVATNAGGLRLFRYGNLHSNILGLEVVKADGEVLDLMSSLKKDNTGYHLKNMFIGSEGTLGVITKVAIQCPPKPSSVNLMFLGLQSFEKVLQTYKRAKTDLGEVLSSVEVMDAATMQFIGDKLGSKSPIGEYPFYLMIETSGSNQGHDEEKMTNFLEYSLEKHLTLNGTLATEPSKIKELWKIRETIPESFHKDLYVFIYDFTMPHQIFFTLVDEFREFLGDKARSVFGFGHMGDGNLHLQIAIDEYSVQLHEYIEERLMKRVHELNGSISAEHGIGFLKSKYLPNVKSANTFKQMQELKSLLDPNGILNPYKTVYMQK